MIIISNRLSKLNLTPAQYITLGFLMIILFGGFILYLPISYVGTIGPSIIDSIFTAASAVCVTGLVVLDTATTWSPFGQLWLTILIQVGGIGFVTILTVISILLKKKVSLSNKILATESLNQHGLNDIINIVKKVIKTTFIIEFIGAIALSLYFIPYYGIGKGIWYSIFHSVSAFCNAGFDLMGTESGVFSSLTGFTSNLYINAILCILIILGGLGFLTISEVFNKKSFKSLSLHSKVVLLTTLFLIVAGAIAVFLLEYSNPNTLGALSTEDKIIASLFQSVTTRTAGFNTLDLSLMRLPTIITLITLMIIGASPASTGGGIKTTTFFIGVLFIKNSILGNEEHNVFGRRIPKSIVNKAISTIFIAISLFVSLLIILTILEPNITLSQAMFECSSVIATVGLSLGVTPLLSFSSKVLLIIGMFLGRVGSITVLIALSTKITQSKPKCNIKYTEENILI